MGAGRFAGSLRSLAEDQLERYGSCVYMLDAAAESGIDLRDQAKATRSTLAKTLTRRQGVLDEMVSGAAAW